jgi:hypothetical protein
MNNLKETFPDMLYIFQCISKLSEDLDTISAKFAALADGLAEDENCSQLIDEFADLLCLKIMDTRTYARELHECGPHMSTPEWALFQMKFEKFLETLDLTPPSDTESHPL